MIHAVIQPHASPSPAFSGQHIHRGNLGSLAVMSVRTPTGAEHLGRRHESACAFKGEKFTTWTGTQADAGREPMFNLLSRFFDTDANPRASAQAAVAVTPTPSTTSGQLSPVESNTAEPPNMASNPRPRHDTAALRPSALPVSVSALAQNRFVSLPELSAAAPASDKPVDMSLPDLTRFRANNPLEIGDLLRALSSKRISDNDSLPALLCSLSRFIKDTEERLAPKRPGVHTMAKRMRLCLGDLEQTQARRVLTRLEGELGSSAHAVIQFAAYKLRSEPGAATTTLVRLSQCEYLLKGLTGGLRSHLHDVGARTHLPTPIVENLNELSPTGRTAFSEALNV